MELAFYCVVSLFFKEEGKWIFALGTEYVHTHLFATSHQFCGKENSI